MEGYLGGNGDGERETFRAVVDIVCKVSIEASWL